MTRFSVAPWRRSRGVAIAFITFATFTDILAYSVAVPVLPDLSRRYGATPTVVGLVFAIFGLAVLVTSVPMGAVSDRIGRKLPLVGGLFALAVSTVFFAFAPTLVWLFVARFVQGAADAITWVVGFALVADMYEPEERGRRMGIVMSGSTFGFLAGPTIGGWLYELGGPRLPYLAVGVCAVAGAIGLSWLRLPEPTHSRDVLPLSRAVSITPVLVCAIAVIVGGGTIAMVEPTLSLYLSSTLGLGPARVGLVFGGGALVATILHPIAGRLADRVGSRRLTIAGVMAVGVLLPAMSLASGFWTAVVLHAVFVVGVAVLITPSLLYMAEAVSSSGVESFGVAYGLYNFAWAVGVLLGPSIGGFLYERLAFSTLYLVWAAVVVAAAIGLARMGRD